MSDDAQARERERERGFSRVQILFLFVRRFTGRSKGFAYVEFEEKESVENAVLLDNSIFKGRQLKVTAKRMNVPGKGGAKGRGGRGGRGTSHTHTHTSPECP